jgi:hypothetical protein
MTTAAVAAGSASGLRAWLGLRRYAWLTDRRVRRITFALVVAMLLVSATQLGSGS